jgi:hypothetical protein
LGCDLDSRSDLRPAGYDNEPIKRNPYDKNDRSGFAQRKNAGKRATRRITDAAKASEGLYRAVLPGEKASFTLKKRFSVTFVSVRAKDVA